MQGAPGTLVPWQGMVSHGWRTPLTGLPNPAWPCSLKVHIFKLKKLSAEPICIGQSTGYLKIHLSPSPLTGSMLQLLLLGLSKCSSQSDLVTFGI